jgi:hypothetical protein
MPISNPLSRFGRIHRSGKDLKIKSPSDELIAEFFSLVK